MTSRLLHMASIVCLVLCVALMAMWVRSYDRWDQIHGWLSSTQGFAVGTLPGRLEARTLFPVSANHWSWGINSVDTSPLVELSVENQRSAPYFGFGVYSNPSVGRFLVIPSWFLVFVTGSLAMAFRLHWPWRFTLRHLFIATTFLAVVLGMITWLDRAWIGK
jgi:hypothetical protein